MASDLPVSKQQLRYIGLIALIGLLWKSFTLRSPWFLLPDMPPLPTPNTCKVFHKDILKFCEDFTTIPDSNLLLISCDPQRHKWNTFTNTHPPNLPPGEIYIFDPTSPLTPPKLVSSIPELTDDFRPLGLSATYSSSSEGNIRVFITNQARAAPKVEVVEIHLPSLSTKHIATITHGLIYSPNGIAAVSSAGFYLTNDAYFSRRRWSQAGVVAEVVTGIPGGSLVYVSFSDDGGVKATRIVRLPLANGVAVDPVHRRVWVAGSLTGVYQYVYTPDDPTVVETGAFLRTAMLPDNILFSKATGGVYVSGATSAGKLLRSIRDVEAPVPPSLTAQLLPMVHREAEKAHIAWRGNDVANVALRRQEWRWGTVFVDDGGVFGGVSTGGVVDGGVFVGVSLVGRGVVVCDEVPVKGGTVPEVKEMVKDEL
ncbi:calcium-dependent phosphotriesterase [Wilcoxina mikolae CBS 423.85]|nr:calcium-dependent phosphotriesterase [Wilcoxina mikolae CBS 423.85]